MFFIVDNFECWCLEQWFERSLSSILQRVLRVGTRCRVAMGNDILGAVTSDFISVPLPASMQRGTSVYHERDIR